MYSHVGTSLKSLGQHFTSPLSEGTLCEMCDTAGHNEYMLLHSKK